MAYVPMYKADLVEYIANYYQAPKYKFNKYKKKSLIKLYCKIRYHSNCLYDRNRNQEQSYFYVSIN